MDSPEKTFKMVSVEKPLDVDIETKVKLYQNVLDNDDSEEERPVDNDQDNNSDKPDTSPKVKYVPRKLGRNFRACARIQEPDDQK